MIHGWLAFIVLSLLAVASSVSASRADRIKKWPGQPSGYTFQQFAGYVQINKSTGKFFYYVFVEAESNPESKPLVLWLNGGPGCSSVWAGFLTEHGPWRIVSPRSNLLKHNPFSWNKVANVIYLESPTGVGFSYSNSSDDYRGNDEITAVDNYLFLAGWMKKFPRFQNHSFFLTGESYAGHYVPQLANEILKRDANPARFSTHVKLNFKGLMIGNPYFQPFSDSHIFSAFYYRYMISSATYRAFLKSCLNDPNSIECFSVYSQAFASIADVDQYDVNSLVCTSSKLDNVPFLKQRDLSRVNKLSKFWKFHKTQMLASVSKSARGELAPSTVPKPFTIGNPACSDLWIYRYMNSPANQKKIHARIAGAERPQAYLPCSETITYDESDGVLPILKKLIAANLRVWILSGDADTVVPFTVTRDDVESLNLSTTRPYHMWYYYDQAGGWVEDFDGLTMLTIRDAGHLFPVRQPERGLYVFKRFLAGKPLLRSPFGTDTT